MIDLMDEVMGGTALGIRVRELRMQRGWSQFDLAVAAKLAPTTIHKIEVGKTIAPRMDALQNIAAAFDMSVDELIPGGNIRHAAGEDELTAQLNARVGPLTEEEEALIERYRLLYAEAQEHVQKQVRLLLYGTFQTDPPNQDPPTHHDDRHRAVGGA